MKNIDWKLLKKQKETLCNVIHDNRHNEMISGDLNGILHLIDAIQDEFEPVITPVIEEEEEKYEPIEGEKFYRKCDATGEGMNEGYFIEASPDITYIKYKKDLIEHLRKLDWEDSSGVKSKSIVDEDELMEFFHYEEYYYWTTWDGNSDEEYIFTNGQIVEIELIESLVEQEEQGLSVAEIKQAIDSILYKIMQNGCEAWEDSLEETKTVIPVEDYRGIKYSGWLQDLTELKNKL